MENQNKKTKNKKIKNCILLILAILLLVLVTIIGIKNTGKNNENIEKNNQDKVIKIYNIDDLRNIGIGDEQYNTNNYILMNDIDLSNEEWQPIGIAGPKFKGIFDGNNHKITGLKNKKNSTEDNQGLFSKLYEATIKNLSISGEMYGEQNVGILAGYSIKSSFENIKIDGKIVADGENIKFIGGLVGNIDSNEYKTTKITNCSSNINIQCKASGKCIGGIAGNISNGVIEKTESIVNILANNEKTVYVGGLVAFAETNVVIKDSYSSGKIKGYDCVGGLIAYIDYNAEIENSYSSVEVDGNNDIGGFIGKETSNTIVKNSYWSNEKSKVNDDTKTLGTNITEEQMAKQETYAQWDFKENEEDTEYTWYMDGKLPKLNI